MTHAGGGLDYDYIVMGSGFGGSVAALRLAEQGHRVAVFEMGRRWRAEDFPKTNWALRRWIWRPGLGLHGFFNIRPFRHVLVLQGCAVGGGSITYANTCLTPDEAVWGHGSWAGLADWAGQMPGYYARAERMLGVAENRIEGPADRLLRQAAEAAGVGGTYRRTRVAVLQPGEGQAGGQACEDPYFGGEGPGRTTCTGCGGCMVGCRVGAKNSLDQNYLYLAEKRGVSVFPETRVVEIQPLEGRADGSAGYAVRTVRSTSRLGRGARRWTCKGVVLAGSALGTTELLLRMKERGRLPRLSAQLGRGVRTNAESLIGVRVPGSELSAGVAIGSRVYLDAETHVEATRYPAGSDAMGLLATVLVAGRAGWQRIPRWAWALGRELARRPWQTLRCLWPAGFARESVILLCMQKVEGQLELRLGRPWFWPFRRVLVSHGASIAGSIPVANEFARRMAEQAGGSAMSLSSEVLFDIPGTAHVLGGCPMGKTAETGVVDDRGRVFGYQNMIICDGSIISANLGVNPSLTITALAERAMAGGGVNGSSGS